MTAKATMRPRRGPDDLQRDLKAKKLGGALRWKAHRLPGSSQVNYEAPARKGVYIVGPGVVGYDVSHLPTSVWSKSNRHLGSGLTLEAAKAAAQRDHDLGGDA